METAIRGLFLFRRDETSGPEAVMYEPSICVLAQGSKRVFPGGDPFEYDCRHFLAASVNIPTIVEVVGASPDEPCLGVVIKIEREEVAELVLEGELPPPKSRATGIGISTGVVIPELLDAVCRLVSLLDEPADIPGLAPLVRREILYRLLTSEQGLRLRQIAIAGSRSHQIARAIDWLKTHFDAPLKVEDLAAQVNMSASSFHHHFRAMTARSPLQYQKWLRLNEARRLMLMEQLDAASAAFQVGYESRSQFSREYGRLFGVPPARDAMRLREASIAAPGVQRK